MDGFLHTLLTMSLTAAIAAGVGVLLPLLLKRDHLPALGVGAAADGLPRRGFPPREPHAGDRFQRCLH